MASKVSCFSFASVCWGLSAFAQAASDAATIAPIARIGYQDELFELPALETRTVSRRIKAYLDGIKAGDMKDELGWCVDV